MKSTEEPENPDKPVDPVDPNDPKNDAATFDAVGISKDAVNIVSNVSEAVVNVTCPEGAKNFFVKIESSNDEFIASAGELMPMEFDLVDPEATGGSASDLASIGLPVKDDVYGKDKVKFDITGLVPLLSAFPGDHSFTLTVVDLKGNQSVLVLKFKAE